MKTVVHGRKARDPLLHVEADGVLVNIHVGLTDSDGHHVTHVAVSPDDETRGGDADGYIWYQDGARIIRLEKGEICPATKTEGRPDPREVVARIEQQIQDERVAACSECAEDLPNAERCEVSDDGEHVPDQELHDPPDDKPTRWIELALRVRVPNDDYDYLSDVVGRLETLLALLNLHPLVSGAGTAGPSGSGFVREVDEW